MKLPQILQILLEEGTEDQKEVEDAAEKILVIQQQISVLEGSRNYWEKILEVKTAEKIRKHHKYLNYSKNLDLNISTGGHKKTNLFDSICKQVAAAVWQHGNKPKEYPNDMIEIETKKYDITRKEINSKLGSDLEKISLEKQFIGLQNEMLKDLGIKIRLVANEDEYIRLAVQIFPNLNHL